MDTINSIILYLKIKERDNLKNFRICLLNGFPTISKSQVCYYSLKKVKEEIS